MYQPLSLYPLLGAVIAVSMATPYGEFQENCTLRSSCQLSPDTTSYHMNCDCDNACPIYGDCCPDVNPKTITHRKYIGDDVRERLSCVTDMHLERDFPVYIMERCEAYFPEEDIKRKCEGVTSNEPDYVGDMFEYIPVTGLNTGLLYRNSFCALCNNEKQFEFWRVNISADDPTLLESVRENIAKSDWAAISKIKIMVEFSHETYKPHMCKNITYKCTKSWQQQDRHYQGCMEGDTNFVYHSYTVYRNLDCAICNDIDPADKKLSCLDTRALFHSGTPVFNYPPSFSLIFDLNEKKLTREQRSGEWVVKVEVVNIDCDEGNVYDPFTGKCRQLFCLPGDILEKDKCVSAADGGAKCLLVSFKKEEFEYLQNRSVYIISISTVYNAGDYWTDGANILICNPSWGQVGENVTRNSTEWEEFFHSDPVQGYVTMALTIVSILGLSAQLIVYTIFVELRNTPGKCLMCLSASLLVAQLLFIIGVNRNEISGLCKAIAILIHYGFLAYFFWMNTMAFDIFRSFTSPRSQSFYRTSKRTIPKRFVHYSLYAWLSPLFIVLISMILDFTKVDPVRPDYGKAFCWFGNSTGQLIFFVLPVSLLILSDIVFFSLTVREIYKVSEGSKKMKSTKNNSEKKRFSLYVKLAFIMGFTWILGFFATLLRSTIVWYIFVVLNSLQGLWIFLTFVCTSKVLNLIKGKSRKDRPFSTSGSGRTRSAILSESSRDRHSGVPHKVRKHEEKDADPATKEHLLSTIKESTA